MTTSKETDWMDHPHIRNLVQEINRLPVGERITLVKGLIPAIAKELPDEEYERFAKLVQLKGERYNEAKQHPGEGRSERKTPGEREIEGRS